MQARHGLITSERALEQSPEESRPLVRQVGPSGWLPRTQQPRDAFPAKESKKGGTASSDATRPFRQWFTGTVRPVLVSTSWSRREIELSDRSTGTDGASAKPSYLRPVTSGYMLPADNEERPTLSLGGSQAVTLKTFTISAGMRGRSLVDDTDFTPDELTEILETATRLKRMHRTGRSAQLSRGQDPGHDLPAPKYPDPCLIRGRHDPAWWSRALPRYERSAIATRRNRQRHRQGDQPLLRCLARPGGQS